MALALEVPGSSKEEGHEGNKRLTQWDPLAVGPAGLAAEAARHLGTVDHQRPSSEARLPA